MNLKTIVLTGPESTGKTTLARQLAEHFETEWVPEFARTYIGQLDRRYTQADLLEIAKGQVAAEEAFAERSKNLLMLDTSLEVIKIWSEYRFGECHPWILEQLRQRSHNLYLLCRPDLPWAFDPQRENPEDRNLLFERYFDELTRLNVKFVEVNGSGEERFQAAVAAVSNLENC